MGRRFVATASATTAAAFTIAANSVTITAAMISVSIIASSIAIGIAIVCLFGFVVVGASSFVDIFVVAVIDWKKMERWWGIKAPILFKVFDDVSYF